MLSRGHPFIVRLGTKREEPVLVCKNKCNCQLQDYKTPEEPGVRKLAENLAGVF